MRVLYAFVYVAVLLTGWFYPAVALGAFGFMGAVILAGRRKKWCGSYCPRGSFFDLVMRRISPRRPIPKWLSGKRAKAVVLVLFIMAFSAQLYLSGILVSFSWIVLGRIFYRMCLVTSLIALPFAMAINQRTWCSFCPVGNLLRK